MIRTPFSTMKCLQDAVVRNIEVIGEAASTPPPNSSTSHDKVFLGMAA